ncbi:hypothetical protein WDU94_006995 [Cyamophila willieti]
MERLDSAISKGIKKETQAKAEVKFYPRLDSAISKGRQKLTHPNVVVKCYPTYVQDLPEGNETGKYLALDIGESVSKFRVLMINCTKKGCETLSEIYPIAQPLLNGPGVELFDYVAQCLADFVNKRHIGKKKLELGLSFGFPVNQTALNEGVLVKWTKGFKCDGVVGRDVVTMLREALDRQNKVNMKIVALINDSTGCLVSCAHEHQDCKIGVIIGTGFNACYVEESKCVTTFTNVNNKPFVIVNTEWGAFGEDGSLDFLLTEFDWTVDETSHNKYSYIYEKMVARPYWGELVRVIMENLTREGLILNGKGSKQLFTPGMITTEDVISVETLAQGNLSICLKFLNDRLALPHATAQDCIDFHYVCSLVAIRSAHLVAAGIACLINRTSFNPITVGLDGSLYRNHPLYHDRLMAKIPKLLKSPKELKLVLAQGGSGRGAALVCAVCAREVIREEERKRREIEEAKERERQRIVEEKRRKEEEELERIKDEIRKEKKKFLVCGSSSSSESGSDSSSGSGSDSNSETDFHWELR